MSNLKTTIDAKDFKYEREYGNWCNIKLGNEELHTFKTEKYKYNVIYANHNVISKFIKNLTASTSMMVELEFYNHTQRSEQTISVQIVGIEEFRSLVKKIEPKAKKLKEIVINIEKKIGSVDIYI